MRKFVLFTVGVTVAAVVGLVVASGTVAGGVAGGSAAPNRLPTSSHLSVTGSVVAGVTGAQSGQDLAFDFTVKNHSRSSANLDWTFTWTHAAYVGTVCPLTTTGFDIDPDGTSCEPGFLAPRQTAQSAIILEVSASPPFTLTVTGCASTYAPPLVCRTLSVPIS
jgi:hypothetical protein